MKRSLVAALALCISMPLHAASLEEMFTQFVSEGIKQFQNLPLTGSDSSDVRETPAEKKEVAKSSAKPPAGQRVEVAFSPDHGAERLVLKSIESAKDSIRLAAYSFTAKPVVAALIAAKKRGVSVKVVVDHKHNFQVCSKGKRCAGAVAAAALVNAGVDVRTVKAYAVLHDKFAIIDGRHIQTGSYNYSQAAAKSNAENVMVIWNNEDVADKYLAQWDRHWKQGSKAPMQY